MDVGLCMRVSLSGDTDLGVLARALAAAWARPGRFGLAGGCPLECGELSPGPPAARPPVRPERWKVGQPRVCGLGGLAVVAVPAAPVLVGDVTPAEVRQRGAWQDPQRLDWVDPPRTDRAQVSPVVAEVEHVSELLARTQPRQPDLLVVLGDDALDVPVRIRVAEPGLVGEGELLQVRTVPAGERVVDGVGKVLEGVAARGCEDPPGPGPVLLSVAFDKFHADRQPGPCQRAPPVPGCLPGWAGPATGQRLVSLIAKVPGQFTRAANRRGGRVPGIPGVPRCPPGWRRRGGRRPRRTRRTARNRQSATRRPHPAGPVRFRRAAPRLPARRTETSYFAGRVTRTRAGTAPVAPPRTAGRPGWLRTSRARRRPGRARSRPGRWCREDAAGPAR